MNALNYCTNSPLCSPLPDTCALQWAFLSSSLLPCSLLAHSLLLAAPLKAGPTLASRPIRHSVTGAIVFTYSKLEVYPVSVD